MIENIELIQTEISKKLKEAGYKLTPQREMTVDTLIEYREKLLTAEEIFIAVKRKNPSIGLETVYRTLDLLEELDLVKKIQLLDGLTRYDLDLSTNTNQSYYLVCSNCGKVKEIKDGMFKNAQIRIEEKYRFLTMKQEITFHGICKRCQEKERV